MILDKRLLLLFGISIFAVVALFFIGPIKQSDSYHLFADTRVIVQVPNFLNVASNLPFLIVGFLGIRLSLSTQPAPALSSLKKPYLLFFIGVLLTGFGSSFYHYNPGNANLLWDRLPITISFMAVFLYRSW